jgi:aromatase
MTHSVEIRCDAESIFRIISSVENWPDIFPPCRRAIVLKRDHASMLIEITAQVGEEVRTWQSLRALYPLERKIEFTQVKSFSPVVSMTGSWQVLPASPMLCEARLVHEFVVTSDERFPSVLDAERWIRKACDENSDCELRALKVAGERAAAEAGRCEEESLSC